MNLLDLLGGAEEWWRRQAACRDLDPELFHPERGASMRPAKDVCAGCTVREACLNYALDNVEQHGIWGGTTENERKRLRRRRGAAARQCPWCRATFSPRHSAQIYCRPEHAAEAAPARKAAATRRAG